MYSVATQKRVRQLPNPFRVESLIARIPQVVAALQPGAEISERLRRYRFKLHRSL
jgi:hypothetical protein